jgi:hypothetical protein
MIQEGTDGRDSETCRSPYDQSFSSSSKVDDAASRIGEICSPISKVLSKSLDCFEKYAPGCHNESVCDHRGPDAAASQICNATRDS